MTPGMLTPIFLSVSRPQHLGQERFLAHIIAALEAHGLAPQTVGLTQICEGSPLPAIRRLMTDVQGLAVVAFRRKWIADAQAWHTSMFCQLEMAMAYQRHLPILVVRERGVLVEGMLDGVPGCCYTPEFDLEGGDDPASMLVAWSALFAEWIGRVRPADQNLSSLG